MARKKGEGIGVSTRRQTAPRLSWEVIKSTKKAALDRDVSYQEFIEKALWHYLRCPQAAKE